MATVLVALFFASIAGHAQILYGSITGTVTDKTGAVVPNVAVTIANQATGQVRSDKANGVGVYDIVNVLPGTYTLSIARTGNFAGFKQQNVQIEVNQALRLDITLQPAAVTTEVTVTTAPAELQTENAQVSSEISATQFGQLPLTSSQGRTFQALYTLLPGAAKVSEQNSTASNPSRAMSMNANGVSYNGNTTRIDGAVNYYGWLPYLIAYVPPADSIQSVTVTTDDFNAEQGLAGGATVNVTTKSGTRNLHGSAWEYYQDADLNARAYTTTIAAVPTLPKNIFNEFGFNIGGPVYLPKILTGRKKLFFFDNWERTTRRTDISNTATVPDTLMTTGNFSEAVSYTNSSGGSGILYDPQPTVGTYPASDYAYGYLLPQYRPSFTAEYGETGSSVNTIPTSRTAPASATMMSDLSKSAAMVTTTAADIAAQMANDWTGEAGYVYNRTTNDAKITYIPTENTQFFGKYSVEPFQVIDPQEFGAAGGGTFDGGQPGAGHGRIQNVGMGFTHVINANTVLDWDFGYTRQVTGAQSTIDVADGDYGLNVLMIPGTNGPGPNYEGQPDFQIGTISSGAAETNGFSGLGNDNGANPFLFRDNQFTGDVNLSWLKGRHSTKYGFSYYHFDLNHFQPTSGGYIDAPRGGFAFQGNMTCSSSCSYTAYNALADFLLGLPNQYGAGPAIAHPEQIYNPNSLRWTELGLYAQDQWQATAKLVLTYGVRYEDYPPPYRDHTGVFTLIPGLPQSANVEIGGVNGNPKNAGLDMGWGQIVPRVGLAYSLDNRTVVRSGFGLTTDPDSLRYLRDAFPEDLAPSYTSLAVGGISVNTATGAAMPFTTCPAAPDCYGIPAPVVPDYSSGFASLPVTGSTTTAFQNFRRGYIESWNLFVQREIGAQFVANLGYVGDHFVRQQAGVNYLNASPLPSASTPCMANGQYNTALTGLSGPCSNDVNEIVNQQSCSINWSACSATNSTGLYNTGGITSTGPLFSSNYNGLQGQLTRRAGTHGSLGVVYTYSHALDYEDNGAGSGAGGAAFSYPGYYKLNYGSAGFDARQNLQVWGVYSLPFGPGQKFLNHGVTADVIGGWQLNGQFSHISGYPFSVSASTNTLDAPGASLYAEEVAPYQQESGHNRTPANTSVSGGKPWFNPASFANPTEPPISTANTSDASPVFPNTTRDEFHGPGDSVLNASIFKAFHIYRETEFQFRMETFNLFNHPQPNNPNTTVGGGTFGYITSFGPSYSPTQGQRQLQFGGRFNF